MSIDIVGSQAAFSGFAAPRVGLTFSITKRFMDVAVSLALLPLLAVCAVLLLVMNHILNRGPLLFCQIRMGRGGRAFVAYKFRSMKPGHGKIRGPYGPVTAPGLASAPESAAMPRPKSGTHKVLKIFGKILDRPLLHQ